MDKNKLVLMAESIPVPPAASGEALEARAGALAVELTKFMLKQSDLESLIGKGNQGMMETNHQNHYKYIASLSSVFDATSLVETVLWVFRTYINHGFTPGYWKVMLPEADRLIETHLSKEEHGTITPIYQWLFDNVDHFAELSKDTPSFFEGLSPEHHGKD